MTQTQYEYYLNSGLRRLCNYKATTITIAYKRITKVLRIKDSQ